MEATDLAKYNFTAQEIIIFQWQFDFMGNFMKSLMNTITLADDMNLILLAKSFPDHVQAVKSWRHGDLRDQLAMKMNESPAVFERFKI